MTRIFLLTLILILISSPLTAFGQNIPDGGDGDAPSDLSDLLCMGPWTNLICALRDIYDVIDSIRDISRTIFSWIPHFFPFGGPILSSEQACGFHVRSVTWTGWNVLGVWFPVPIPFSGTIGLAGRAIEVGPPVPSGGKIITFPWISKIYQNHTENRAGPWALGLGFTPFPLDEINDAIGSIRIWIPPTLVNRDCLIPDPTWYGRVGFLATCIDHLSYECVASGETDDQGNPVYKVIRRLGTSPNDVSPEAMNALRNHFPNFPWP